MIPRLSIGLMRSGFERTLVNGRPVFRSVPGNLREDLLNLGLSALLDEDSIVRQNVLKHHTRIRLPLPASTLAHYSRIRIQLWFYLHWITSVFMRVMIPF